MKTLRQYQVIGKEFLKANRACILADEPGLGKTLQVTEAIKELRPKSILIITPQSLKSKWYSDIISDAGLTNPIIQILYKYTDRFVSGANVIILNYDLLVSESIRQQLKARKFSIMVCDEAHYLKNVFSDRTKYILRKHGIYKNAYYNWFITGTPIMNRPVELFPILRATNKNILGKYEKYMDYVRYFCNAHQTPYGLDVNGAANLDELSLMLQTVMLRRTLSEVMPELDGLLVPKLVPISIKFEASHYDATETQRVFLANQKKDFCVSYIRELLLTTSKVVVFAVHTKLIDSLHQELSDSIVIDGRVSKKQQALDLFISNPALRVLIAQTDACGEGLDGLQHIQGRIVFAELHWNPKKIEQAIARMLRFGRKDLVLCDFIVADNSDMERRMYEAVKEKMEIINKVLKEKKDLSI